MATINSRKAVDDLIAKGGRDGHMHVVKIVQYNNMFDGGVCYGLIYSGQRLDLYDESFSVRNPKVLWEKGKTV